MLLKILSPRPTLNLKLGRIVYGNLTSFTHNFEGRKNLKRARRTLPRLAKKLEFIHHMEKYGYYSCPVTIPVSIMDQVITNYTEALVDPLRSNGVMSLRAEQDGLEEYCRSIDEPMLPELNLLLTPEIKNLIHNYFNGEPTLYLGCARRNHYIPPLIAKEYDVYSNTWHCDNERSDRIKMFVALNDIDKHCGPLHFLPRPRTRQVLKKGFNHRDDYNISTEIIEDPAYLRTFEGKKGSVLFLNVTQCLHRAGVPQEGRYRDIAEFQFRAKDPA